MAGDAGTLEVKMVMGLARLQQDVTQAKDIIGRGMAGIESAVRVATVALGALGATLSVGFFANLVKGSIDAMDHLNDLSKSTNLSIETLAGLKLAARQTGSDLDGTAAAINKLSVNIGNNTEKFAKLGITAKDPLEAFKQLADVTNAILDPQQRAAVLAEALGKSWQQAAPLLAEGGKKIGEMVEEGAKLSGITTDMARQADDLNDKWAKLTGNGGLLNAVVGASLPLMNKLAQDLLDVREKGDGATTFAMHFKDALGFLVTVAGDVVYVLKGMGLELGGIAAQGAALLSVQFQLMTGNVSGAIKEFQRFGDISDQMKADAVANRAAHEEWKSSIAAVGVTAGLAANQVKGMTEAEAEAAFIVADNVKRFLAKADAAGKAAKAMKDLGDAHAHVTTWMKFMNEEAKRAADLQEAIRKDTEALNAALGKQVQTVVDLIEREEFANKTRGMTRSAIEDVIVARLEEQVAVLRTIEGAGAEVRALELQIEKRKELRNVIGTGEQQVAQIEAITQAQRNSASVWNEMADAAGNFFSDLVMNGRSAFDNLRTSLKQLLADMIALFAKRWILQLVGSGSAGDVGSNTLAGSALSGIGSWLSGGTSIGGSLMGAAGNFQAGWAAAGQGIQLANGAPAMQQFGAAVRGATGALGIFSAVAAGMLLNNSYFSQGWRADNQSSSLRNFDRMFAAPGLGLSGDAFWRRLGLSDRMASLLSGSSLHSRIWGVGPLHADAYGVRGSVGASGITGENWQDWSRRGGLFHGDERGTAPADFSADQATFWQNFMQGISGVTGPLAQALGQNLSTVLGGYNRAFNMQLSDNGDPLSNEKINALFNQLFTDVLRDQVTMLFDAAGESEIADYIRGLTGDVDEIKGQILDVVGVFHGLRAVAEDFNGLDFSALQMFQLEGETIAQTFERVVGAWSELEDAFTSSDTRLANAHTQLGALNVALEAAGIEMPTTREEWLSVMRGLDQGTESGHNLWLLMLQLAPSFDLATAAAERIKDELLGLARMRFLHAGGSEQAFLIQQLLGHNPLLAAGTAGMSIEQFIANLWTISDEDYLRYTENDRRIIDTILGADLHNTAALDHLGDTIGGSASGRSPAEQAFEDYYRSQGARRGISDYLQGLNTGPLSPLPTDQQLTSSWDTFRTILTAAQGGDLTALSRLTSQADIVLGLARQMYGSTSTYGDIFRSVTAALQSVAAPDTQAQSLVVQQKSLTTQQDIYSVLIQIRDQAPSNAGMIAEATTASGERVAAAVSSDVERK